jgi:cellulose synthase/poly-beta-1,6-N-acetylglucosamine synthase-like glycosyltransferase
MINFVNTLITLVSCFLLWPLSILLIEVMSACFKSEKSTVPTDFQGSVCVLIPAHNEAIGIARTIESVRASIGEFDRVLVVADNCDDATASVARIAGAEVIERTDAYLRGKGYALAFGVDYLAKSPPEAVVIIDADCLVIAGSLKSLAATCLANQRPVQASNMMQWPTNYRTSIPQRIAGFAWIFKNHVRPLGLLKSGFPCQLMGTGMAFPWSLIRRLNLATGEIVEDIKTGIECCLLGAAPLYSPQTEVLSYFPTSASAEKSQRTRWEHGHVGIVLRHLPRLLLRSLKTGNTQLFVLVSDLTVFPLALLSGIATASFIASALFASISGLGWIIYLPSANLLCLSLAVLIGWYFFGRDAIRCRDFLLVPFYILKKVPLYFKMAFNRQTEWVRTKRDDN